MRIEWYLEPGAAEVWFDCSTYTGRHYSGSIVREWELIAFRRVLLLSVIHGKREGKRA